MTTPNDVLAQGRKWIGTAEQPLGSNHVPGVTDWYNMDRQAWCAMWVSRVFFDAGLPLPFSTSKGFAYCPSGVLGFKRAGRWKTTNPQPGDVVFYDWGSGLAKHVGIVESVRGDRDVFALEGNTNSKGGAEGLYVMRQHRTRNILGYGSPAFDGSSAAPAVPAPAWGLLVEDGDFGDLTKKALQRALNSTGARPLLVIDGDFGDRTKRALQGRLNHTNGPVKIDGQIGENTIKALQRHVGAKDDGDWGSGTTTALQKTLNRNAF